MLLISSASDVSGVVFIDIGGTLVPAPGSAVYVARYLGTEAIGGTLVPAPGSAVYVARYLGTEAIGGTLVPAPGSAVYVARYLGTEAAMAEAEADYAAGRLTNPQVAAADAKTWSGYTEREIDDWLAGVPLVDGIEETVAWCRGEGLIPVLATLAWQSIGKHLCHRFGFEAYCGPELETAEGRFTGRVLAELDEYGKRDFAVRYAGSFRPRASRLRRHRRQPLRPAALQGGGAEHRVQRRPAGT
ncbi:haloacid dehalogenase-like hydrolase [Streptomyces sp. NBC_01474]|uniref:haloacid dehalogenase-like hydrolase n=1 Tax=Streptomyces sp. NBC_01474 TaxID=2903880 RepID=UPI002DDC2F45|nr:haloacid dehalogenase-like hydrolase [Streptomyces sp. NBC_01474]